VRMWSADNISLLNAPGSVGMFVSLYLLYDEQIQREAAEASWQHQIAGRRTNGTAGDLIFWQVDVSVPPRDVVRMTLAR
jgi:hypothetical protein